MRIGHAGKLPPNEAIAKVAPTAAMKRSAPIRTRFKGSLSTTAPARPPNKAITCDNGRCKIYNLDFPDVIALRQQLLPAGEREQNIPCDLKAPAWFDKIDASGGAVFFASGVFYYFLTEQVKTLVQKMADAFPGGVLVFDAANRTAVKMIAKTWLKSAKIKDVGAYFAVSDAKSELSLWDSRLLVTSRGYMLGYNDLRDPSVSGFFRFLAKVGDGMMKMQIVKIGFGGKQ